MANKKSYYFYGNEESSIDFDGNEQIFSKLKLPVFQSRDKKLRADPKSAIRSQPHVPLVQYCSMPELCARDDGNSFGCCSDSLRTLSQKKLVQ